MYTVSTKSLNSTTAMSPIEDKALSKPSSLPFSKIAKVAGGLVGGLALAGLFYAYNQNQTCQPDQKKSSLSLAIASITPEACNSTMFKAQTALLNLFFSDSEKLGSVKKYVEVANFKALGCLVDRGETKAQDALNNALRAQLFNAESSKDSEKIKLLIENGADLNLRWVAYTPKHPKFKSHDSYRYCEFPEEFLFWDQKRCVDLAVVSPLQTAVRIQDLDLFKYLVEKGADSNILSMPTNSAFLDKTDFLSDSLSKLRKSSKRALEFLEILSNSPSAMCGKFSEQSWKAPEPTRTWLYYESNTVAQISHPKPENGHQGAIG